MKIRMMVYRLSVLALLGFGLAVIAETQTCYAQKTLSATTSARFRVVTPIGINGQEVPQALLTLRSAQEYALEEASGSATHVPESEPGLNPKEIEVSGAMTVEADGRSFMRIDPRSRMYENLVTDSDRQDPMILIALTGN